MELAITLTAIAALLTGIVNFFMLAEMKKQRTAISKPVLKLLSKNTNAILDSKTGAWAWEESDTNTFRKLNFLNFGAGPAINVSIEWEFDFELLINSLKHFDPYSQIKLEYKNGLLYLGDSIHVIKNQRSEIIDAIPVYSSGEKQGLNIPLYYFSCIKKYIQLGLLERPETKSGNMESFDLPDFQNLNVDIKYEDINGNKIKQKFSILLNIASVKKPQNEEAGNVHSRLRRKLSLHFPFRCKTHLLAR